MASKRLGTAAALALVAAVVPLASTGAGAAPPDDVVPGAWIVTVAAGVAPHEVAADHGRRLGAEVSHVYGHAARGYAARMSSAAAAKAAGDPRVAAVVPDRYVHTAAKPAGNTTQPPQLPPTGIDRVYVDAEPGLDLTGPAVAVIDTGIERHPDLNVVGGYNCSTGSSWNDGNGHGTHVAGTIGAKNNTSGVVGVAPGVPLYAVRVLNNAGSGTWSSIICGINWVKANAVAKNIKVANMSLGGGGSDTGCDDGGLHRAICDADDAVTFVVAAGNESDDAARHVPTAYDEVITVSALADFDGKGGELASSTCRTDRDDTFADFSNHGTDVDIIAPGVCIRSTWKGGGYNTISGTSMAAPHVAGAAALYLAHNSAASVIDVRDALTRTATSDWNNYDDRDAVKESLLKVDTL
ncbi:MAG TPA: S8 family serine peptidase [Acidimicrobiales bacterium]|nr:S8 family serine peptidase [Acidimicrobiales bacterium]